MPNNRHTFRILYAETDRMDRYYNAHLMVWFEAGRGELARSMGIPYATWEERGVYLPLTEAGMKFLNPATYDDELTMTTSVAPQGRVRLRFDYQLEHTESGLPVATGFTVHAIVGQDGKPMRQPDWIMEAMGFDV